MSLGRRDAGRSDEGRNTCRDAATARTHRTAPHSCAGGSAFGHQISRRAAGWAVGRCQAALGGDSTQLGVTPGPASATSATTNQETHAPTNSGGTGGMRPLSAEIPPRCSARHTPPCPPREAPRRSRGRGRGGYPRRPRLRRRVCPEDPGSRHGWPARAETRAMPPSRGGRCAGTSYGDDGGSWLEVTFCSVRCN